MKVFEVFIAALLTVYVTTMVLITIIFYYCLHDA